MTILPIAFRQRGRTTAGFPFGFLHAARWLSFQIAGDPMKPPFSTHNSLSQMAQACVIALRWSL